jgi:RHS repeat-associated protein
VATVQQSASYVYARYIDEVLQMQRGGNAYYYHTDDQYNVTALTNAAGAVVERYDYGDFGQPEFYNAGGTPLTGTAYGNPYLFTGRRWDDESGLYYYRSRYYDPAIGQFTTRDPIGVWGDPLNMGNAYAYCGNNPWTLVDPWGLWGEWQVLKDGPGAIWWCLCGEEDPSIGQPITAEQVEKANEDRMAGSRGPLDAAESDGFIPLQPGANFPHDAQYAVNTGLQVGGRAVALGFIPAGFIASPAVVFTGDALFVMGDMGDGRLDDPVSAVLVFIGGTGKARSALCGDEVARWVKRGKPLNGHHPWSKYLGGPPTKKYLVNLPDWLHWEYHARLDKALPRWRSKKYYDSLSPQEQAENFMLLREITLDFDAEFGTSLWEAIKKVASSS